ncbi:MAG: serine hydrolase domain-containing protein [Clostridiaceae bacterium]
MLEKELHKYIEEKQPNICQIVAYKDGLEVYSDTFNGYKKSDACHVMSVTKSIVSLLVGIAIDKGLIKSLDQPVLDYFPDYKIKRGEKTIQKVTIKHLLTMTAPYKYKYEPWTKVCTQDDWTIAALDFLGGRKGINGEFKYSTLGIHILTGIISKTSGMETVQFANKYLFEPIGVKSHRNYLAETAEEHKHFTISKEPRENVWFCDPQGVGAAGYGLCLSAEDMAKIGLLCLNKGKYKGNQIVSSEWLEESTKGSRCNCGDAFRNMYYGYLWWIIDKEKKIFSAIGNSGNVIYVNPEKNNVVAITAYFKPTIFDRVDFIREYIEPYMDDKIV